MECDLLVREDHRCEGIGSRLLATICDETLNEGRSLLTKAAMLERVRHERPGAQRVRTDGAFSNAPMLAIYDAFGFKAIGTRTEW